MYITELHIRLIHSNIRNYFLFPSNGFRVNNIRLCQTNDIRSSMSAIYQSNESFFIPQRWWEIHNVKIASLGLTQIVWRRGTSFLGVHVRPIKWPFSGRWVQAVLECFKMHQTCREGRVQFSGLHDERKVKGLDIRRDIYDSLNLVQLARHVKRRMCKV